MEIPNPDDLPSDTSGLMPHKPGAGPTLPAGPAPVELPVLASTLPPTNRFNTMCRTSGEVTPECEPHRVQERIDMSALHGPPAPNPYTLNIHMTSLHVGTNGKNYSDKFNRDNFGVGVERRLSDSVSLEAGYYNNSYNRSTFYAAASYLPLQAKLGDLTLKAGVMAGVATGYEQEAPKISRGGLTPMVTIKATVDHKSGWGVGVQVLPPINIAAVSDDKGGQKKQPNIGAIGLSLRYKF